MALTPAERAKRYRDKIKKDPVKLKVHKEKKSHRMKSYYNKKVKDLTEEQKEEQRSKWREQKKKQSQRKKTENKLNHNVDEASTSSTLKTAETPKSSRNSSNTVIARYKKLMTVHKRTLKSVDQYKKTINRLRKALTRQKQYSEITIKQLQSENDKIKARQEFMEQTVKNVYKNAHRRAEKQKIKRAIQTQPKKLCKRSEAKILGLKYPIRMRQKKNRSVRQEILQDLDCFFNRDDISRMTAGKRETRTKAKKKTQIRYLVDTLQNLYEVYKNEGGKISFSTFCRYRPYYVLSPTAQRRETCLCIKHSNMEFMFLALKHKGVVTHKNLEELLIASACDTKSYACMYNKCEQCKNMSIQHCDNINSEEMAWSKWIRVSHTYQKAGKQLTTKKTVKQQMKGTIHELLTELEKEMPAFKTHYFNWKEQHRQYRSCINNLTDDEIVVICDFSENYECKYGQEIQSTHFGASKNSISLHTGMIFSKDSSQSFATLSDNSCHEPNAIWAHLMPILSHSKNMVTKRNKIHFFSDGPSSQYRQKKNFYLLTLFSSKFRVSSTWSFSEAGHGKSIADGIGGSIKRTLDKRVSYGEDITNATDAYNILSKSGTAIKCFLIPEEDIANFKRLVPDNLVAVPGTMQLHQITTKQLNLIQYRQLSCFCGETHGFCNCYSPKSHSFIRKHISVHSAAPMVTETSRRSEMVSNVDNDLNAPDLLWSSNFNILTDNFQQDSVLFNCKGPQFCNKYCNNDHYNCDIEFSEFNNPSTSTLRDEFLDALEVPSTSCLLPNQEILDIPLHTKFPIAAKVSTSKYEDDLMSKKKVTILRPISTHNEHSPSAKRHIVPQTKAEPVQTLSNKENKLRKMSSRSFLCLTCKKRKDFNLGEMVKCMVCGNWVCSSCSGTTFFDYICNTCLGE